MIDAHPPTSAITRNFDTRARVTTAVRPGSIGRTVIGNFVARNRARNKGNEVQGGGETDAGRRWIGKGEKREGTERRTRARGRASGPQLRSDSAAITGVGTACSSRACYTLRRSCAAKLQRFARRCTVAATARSAARPGIARLSSSRLQWQTANPQRDVHAKRCRSKETRHIFVYIPLRQTDRNRPEDKIARGINEFARTGRSRLISACLRIADNPSILAKHLPLP